MLGEDNTLKLHKTVLKKVCATRWEAYHQAIFALKERFNDVLITLTKITLTTTNGDERNVSKSIRSKLDSVEFILLLCLWERVLRSMQGVSKVLQSVDINIQTSCGLLKQAIRSLSELRQNYNDIVNIANDLCSKWGISSKFPSKRQQFTKLHFDEIDGDRRLNIAEENFRIKIFYPVVNTSLAQVKNRFKELKTIIASTFEFLNPTLLRSTEENDLIKCSFDFIQLYKSDVTSDFTRQLLSIQSIVKNKLDIRNINDVLIFIVNNDLSTAFCDVLTACIIFLTIPVTVASAERSFSKLKLIKNYLRNLLSIERGRTDEINIETIIADFANAKARKKMFFFNT